MRGPSRAKRFVSGKIYRIGEDKNEVEYENKTLNNRFNIGSLNGKAEEYSSDHPEDVFLSCKIMYTGDPHAEQVHSTIFLEDSHYNVFKGGQRVAGGEPWDSTTVLLSGWYNFGLFYLPDMTGKRKSPAQFHRAVPYHGEAEPRSNAGEFVSESDLKPDWSIAQEDVSDEDFDRFMDGITLKDFDRSLSPPEVLDRLGAEEQLLDLADEGHEDSLLIFTAVTPSDEFLAEKFSLHMIVGGEHRFELNEPPQT